MTKAAKIIRGIAYLLRLIMNIVNTFKKKGENNVKTEGNKEQ